MDLPLYTRILWRHRKVLFIGLGVAVFLATLSFYRVTVDGVVPTLTPRKAEVWQSGANLFLTEQGFAAGSQARYNNASRFTGLGIIYAKLAKSDPVKKVIEKSGPLPGTYDVAPIVDTTAGPVPLPMITLVGRAGSASAAKATAVRAVDGFLAYVRAKQVGAGIPKNQRIQIRVLNAPGPAVLVEPRKRTLPVVVFLAVMIAVTALVFMLENRSLSQSRRLLELAPEPQVAGVDAETVRTRTSIPAEAYVEPVAPAEPEPEPSVTAARRWA